MGAVEGAARLRLGAGRVNEREMMECDNCGTEGVDIWQDQTGLRLCNLCLIVLQRIEDERGSQ